MKNIPSLCILSELKDFENEIKGSKISYGSLHFGFSEKNSSFFLFKKSAMFGLKRYEIFISDTIH